MTKKKLTKADWQRALQSPEFVAFAEANPPKKTVQPKKDSKP